MALTETDVAAVTETLRRVFARRVIDEHQLNDLVQETWVRVLRARPELTGEELIAYSIVVARNVLIDAARRTRDLPPRLVGSAVPDDPEVLALRSEERRALQQALTALPDEDRLALLDHEVEGRTTGELAKTAGSTAGAVAARLARARARARVDYVVALRGASLPTDRCLPVLVSLSAGTRRRQKELAAAEHLLACEACADLAPPVLERRPSLAGLIPIAGFPALLGRIRRFVGDHPVGSAAAAGVVAGVAIVAAMAGPGEDRPAPDRSAALSPVAPVTTGAGEPPAGTAPAPAPSCAASDERGGTVPLVAEELVAWVGATVSVRGATVSAVPADEGFWVDCAGAPLWMQLTVGTESPVDVMSGQRVDATGTVVGHASGFADAVGVTAEEGGAELDALGAHLQIPLDALSVAG